MPSRNAKQMVGKIDDLVNVTGRARKTSVIDMSLVAKDIMNDALKKQGIRQPGSVSKETGLRLPRAAFNIRGRQNPTALVRYFGPAHWWESGTKPHAMTFKKVVGSRRTRVRKAERGQLGRIREGSPGALQFPGGNMRAVARHPGMSARPQWKTTKRRISDGAPRVLQSGFRRNLAESTFGK